MQIDDAADYIILCCEEKGLFLNLLKLQTLLYYCQAFHLAQHDTPLFMGAFNAGIFGPKNLSLQQRFRGTYSQFSDITLNDVLPNSIWPDEHDRAHIDSVLEAYASLSSDQLSDIVRHEVPWLRARQECPDTEICQRDIDETLMRDFYRHQQEWYAIEKKEKRSENTDVPTFCVDEIRGWPQYVQALADHYGCVHITKPDGARMATIYGLEKESSTFK